MDRKLTKEQMSKINDDMPSTAKYGDVFESIVQTQIRQDNDWIKSHPYRISGKIGLYYLVPLSEVK